MKNKPHITLIFLLLPFLLFAQQTITIQLEQRPVTELFDAIESQTSFKVYCLPEDTDSLFISLNITNAEPLSVLESILDTTSLKVSRYENNLFIADNLELVTSLPPDYFNESGNADGVTYDGSGFLLSLSRREQKASSENKVYEIGEPSANATGRVNLSGNITDFKTGEPMIGVALYINDPMVGTTSDAFGYYTIQLPVGRHDLHIRGMGLKDTRRQIVLHSEGKLDIELEEQVYSLKEVTISSEKIENVRSTTMGVERLKIRDIKNIPTAFGEVDIIRAVMSLPGVKAVGEASSGFNVRGGSTDQNLILFNDGTIYNPTHLFGFFSAFNPDLVKDMELYKSSIPAKYGGRISSVLDITSREGNKKEFKGSASIGFFTSRLTL